MILRIDRLAIELPIPDISNKRFPEAMKHEAKGLHQLMYRMSLDDYGDISQILEGTAPPASVPAPSAKDPHPQRQFLSYLLTLPSFSSSQPAVALSRTSMGGTCPPSNL
jgi:hypothetical protein